MSTSREYRVLTARLLASALLFSMAALPLLAQDSDKAGNTAKQSTGKARQRTTEPGQNRFEADIQRFEATDRVALYAPNPIVFVGSSSVRRWDTGKSFPNLNVLNRGFGGSQMSDSVYFADRIVTKYQPKVVVFYAGDNDIPAGKAPEQLLADYKSFTEKVHAKLPDTRIVFISIKPSVKRWDLVDKYRKANELIRAYVKTDPRQIYVDVEPMMLGSDGKPRPDLYVSDGLHLSATGYALWNATLTPVLEALTKLK